MANIIVVASARDRVRILRQHVRIQRAFEDGFRNRLRREFQRQLRQLVTFVENSPSIDTLLNRIDGLFVDFEQRLRRVFFQHYRMIYDELAVPTLEQIIRRFQKDAHNELVIRRQEFLLRHGSQKVTKVNNTTKKYINRLLVEGIGEGEGTVELARRLKPVIRQRSGRLSPFQRTFAIARTETHTSSTVAMQDGVAATGFKPRRQWLTFIDGRERDHHADVDGDVVEFDQPFDVDGEELMVPGDPNGSPGNIINCRCQVLYLPIEL